MSILKNLLRKPETKESKVSVGENQIQENPEALRTGETYERWGRRICGKVTGDSNSLAPFLQKVYYQLYREQAKDNEKQEAHKKELHAEIDNKNIEIEHENKKKANLKDELVDIDDKIRELEDERTRLKKGEGEVNKEQKLKLIIGGIILIILTVYLFLFYSSTFYSAFFRDPASMTNVGNAMFDSNALGNAVAAGITELGFVLTAPIIFMGLGFGLHFFSVQEDKIKYAKMTAVVLVTLAFDCILAFLIGKQLHNFGIMIGTVDIGAPYGLSEAFSDINTWAVIFCGFIVYIIWGIVFDMTLTAYENMVSRKTEIRRIDARIDAAKENKKQKNMAISTTEAKITQLKQQIKDITTKIGNSIFINYDEIKTEMNNFFAGWILMMTTLTMSEDEKSKARKIYEQQIDLLINKNSQQ